MDSSLDDLFVLILWVLQFYTYLNTLYKNLLSKNKCLN